MNPVTHEQEFLQYQISRLVEQQGKTNELLSELIKKLEQPKEVATTKKRVAKKEVQDA